MTTTATPMTSIDDWVESQPTHSYKCVFCDGWFSLRDGVRVPSVLFSAPGTVCECVNPVRRPVPAGGQIAVAREIDWGTSW